MSFIEELKEHLQHVRAAQDGLTETSPFIPEASWTRAEFIRIFERFERAQPNPVAGQLKRTYEEWREGEHVVSFARNLAILLQESFLHGEPPTVVEEHLRLGMARRLGLNDSASSLARQLEIDRLASKAWYQRPPPSTGPLTQIPKYVFEIRAVRRKAGHFELAPIGAVILSLSGRDAIQWLLQVEIAQSMGPIDDWRLSKETAGHLLDHPEDVRPDFKWEESELVRSWGTLRRLKAMGLLELIEDQSISGGPYSGYRLLSEGRRILESLLTPTESPFSVLAATLSQDESLTALEKEGGKVGVDTVFSSSAIATARQARLVVHEIRNALIPAQLALGSLYNSMVGGQSEAELARFRPRIDPGIDRALKFVTDLLKTSELAARAPEAFDLLRSLADAVSSLSTSLRIHLQGTTDLPSLSGYRERFVLAIVNLLRNSEQAGARQVLIESALEANNRNILVTVEDDGPGVPAADRERIFQRGISLRTGGAGEGLALVKEVVEIELHGKIACVDKPDGGARFRMRLPVAERTPR